MIKVLKAKKGKEKSAMHKIKEEKVAKERMKKEEKNRFALVLMNRSEANFTLH